MQLARLSIRERLRTTDGSGLSSASGPPAHEISILLDFLAAFDNRESTIVGLAQWEQLQM